MLICHFGQKSCLPKPWLTWKLLLIAHLMFKKSVTATVKSGDLFYLVHSCMLALCAQSIFLFLLECLPAVCSSPQGLCYRDSRSSCLNLMTLCRSVFFGGMFLTKSLRIFKLFPSATSLFSDCMGNVFVAAGEGGSETRSQRGLSPRRLCSRLQQRSRDRGGLPGMCWTQQGKNTGTALLTVCCANTYSCPLWS